VIERPPSISASFKPVVVLFAALAVALSLSGKLDAARAESVERARSLEAEEAFAEGRYADAYKVLEKAIAECAAPSDQPDYCLQLLIMAPTYANVADDVEASEQLARNAIAVAQSIPDGGGREYEVIARLSLSNAVFSQARIAEAETIGREALARARDVFGQTHIVTASAQNSLALVLDAQSKHSEAEPLHRASIENTEAGLGPEAANLPTLYNGLGDNLTEQARYREAETVLSDALRLAEKINGEHHPVTSFNLGSLGNIKEMLGKFGEAEKLYQKALEIDSNALGSAHALVGRDLNNLGTLYLNQGRLPEAEAQFRKALTTAELSSGVSSPAVSSDLANLANTLLFAGRAAEGEPLIRRAIEIDRKTFGDESARVAADYGVLAGNLEAQLRLTEAEPLRRRILGMNEVIYGPNHPATAAGLVGLAANLSARGRHDDGEPLLRQALAIEEQVTGRDSITVARTLNALAVLESRAGLKNEGEIFFRQALAIRKARLGERHPDTATSYNNLAAILDLQNKAREAEASARRGLEIRNALLPPFHPDIAASKMTLARILSRRPKGLPEAFTLARDAMHVARARRAPAQADQGRTVFSEQSARALGARDPLSAAFSTFLTLAATTSETSSANFGALRAEAFLAAQDLEVSQAGLAMAQTAARQAAGTGALAELARKQQDLATRIKVLDAKAVEAVGQGLADKAQALNREIAAASTLLTTTDEQLRRDFPAYSSLIATHAISISEVQKLLSSDEALLMIVPVAEDIHIFAVSADEADWKRLDRRQADLRDHVWKLRCQVDPKTCGSPGEVSEEFDAQTAHALFSLVVEPMDQIIRNKKRLFVTAAGPIADLPLDMLITSAPSENDGGAENLAKLHWLGDRHALVTLPSISAFRTGSKKPLVSNGVPFVGYGDPQLGGAFKDFAPLAGTRRELEALAEVMGSEPSAITLGAAATEEAVRADRRIGNAGVVVFATHGLLPGELDGRNEPGLVLSFPVTENPWDDGLLGASEAAALSLNAEWVILSACYTASSERGSDSLSALGRAFLYAGAKSLLASHWRVADDATAALTVETMATAKAHPELSRSGARQVAIRAIRSGKRSDGSVVANWTVSWAHPSAWAPFSLIAGDD
jgi:CHAT domain-containing protein/Tfp pilus assembly protein PilF